MSSYTNCLALSPYDQNICGLTEKGRIRAIALLKNGTSIANPSNQSSWESLETSSSAQITAGQLPSLIVIRNVRGSKSDSPIEGPGFGNTPSDFQGFNFEVVCADENVSVANVAFYNSLSKISKNYRLWYVTESLVWQTTETPVIIPNLAITEDVASAINWSITIKWASEDQPTPYGIPGEFFEID